MAFESALYSHCTGRCVPCLIPAGSRETSVMPLRGVLSCCAGWGGAVRSWTWLDCCAARARNLAAALRGLGLTQGIGTRRTALLCRAENWRRGPHTLVDLIASLSRV